jgi:hypothetical protein
MLQASGAYLAVLENVAPADFTLSNITTDL